MAFEHLRASMTKGNLWMYILFELKRGDASPARIRADVSARRGFAPAAITFYSVLYKLRREGLVRKSSESFRSAYSITVQGRDELERALEFLNELGDGLAQD